MDVSANVRTVPATTVVDSVTLSLTHDEAMKLRRTCYYNITVGEKYANNSIGGEAKGSAVRDFLNDLGNALKANGIERF
jgi:hypothetical protein